MPEDSAKSPLAIDQPLIYHIFADAGVEREPLSGYGDVVRVGWDAKDTNSSHPVKADANHLPLRGGADLALLHPPCQRFSPATRLQGGDPKDHPNLIPLAREIGSEYADDYIIENVPDAPLHNPVTLEGRMFGLPISYRRAFETSFHVEQPPVHGNLLADGGKLGDHRDTGGWQGPKELWRSIKQVSGEYTSNEIKRSGIPAPYIHYLMRWYHDE